MKEPPAKPGQIPEADFNRFELITQGNIHEILKDIQTGDRDELNGYYLEINDYLTLAGWMQSIEKYILEAEVHFAEDDRRYNDFINQNQETPNGRNSRTTPEEE